MIARLLCTLLALGVVTIGCGSDSSPPETPESRGSADGEFPAKVEHKYGTTTIPSKPERIVSVGFTEHDTLLALGEKPIATSEWYGDQPYATWPWARDELGSTKPTVLNNGDGFRFEEIAALKPDLILGVNAGMTKEDYEKLSAFAPTIAPVEGSLDWFSEWDAQIRQIAAALGRPEDGEALVKRVKDSYAKAAREHPEFEGKVVSFVQNGFYDGLIYAYQDGLATDFLTMLGFEINPKLTPLVENRGEQVGLAEDQLDVLDADAIVFATEKPDDLTALREVPTFNKLDAVRNKRAVFTDPTLAGAMYFMTPLSLDYVLEHLTPQLEKALAGEQPQKVGAG